MKIHSIAYTFIALVLACVGCTNGHSRTELPPMGVDSLLSVADAFLDDTVRVEGLCRHICFQDGRKAFLQGSDTASILRCEATEALGPFSDKCLDHNIIVTGRLCEDRISEHEIAAMEAQLLRSDTICYPDGPCPREQSAQQKQNLQSFSERIAEYRRLIDERTRTESKPYLSFYYVAVTTYTIVESSDE